MKNKLEAIHNIQKALALMSSMIKGGEDFTDSSHAIVALALTDAAWLAEIESD